MVRFKRYKSKGVGYIPIVMCDIASQRLKRKKDERKNILNHIASRRLRIALFLSWRSQKKVILGFLILSFAENNLYSRISELATGSFRATSTIPLITSDGTQPITSTTVPSPENPTNKCSKFLTQCFA